MSEFDAVASRLVEELPELCARHDIPGLAVGITDASGRTWTAAFGTTRRRGSDPVTPTTMFSLQSCSKTYTATGVMLAAQYGLIDLDRPVTGYLPEFTVHSSFESAPERRMTLRHLLSHTAGFTHEAPIGNNFVVGRAPFAAHCRSISDTWLRFPVGHHYEYSNLGIDLAAFIVERVSGLPFRTFQAKHLLEPLGLARTTFDQRKIAKDTDRALGHSSDATKLPLRIPMVAAGGLYASIQDVCRFIQFHLRRGESLLGSALLDEMYAVPRKQPGQQGGYGLGIVDAGWYRGHSGGGFGFLSDMYWAPEAGVGVAVLTNSNSHPLQPVLSDRILRELAGSPPEREPVHRPSVRASEQELARMSGQYVGRSSTISILLEDGLFMDSGTGKQPLRLVAPGEVVLQANESESWRLVSGADGRARYLIAGADGRVWYRNDPHDSAPPSVGPDWGGRYYQRRMGGRRTPVTLGVDERGPFVREPGQPRLRLEQHQPGLFFSTMGEALDLRPTPATYRNIALIRSGAG
ncbi:MAG TPA: serine hydrolase domain-containing protein [Tepidiformaceae bacterium]|nr:serine hydrolase domain-containing protein [Tepidiformaceae bacterium]